MPLAQGAEDDGTDVTAVEYLKRREWSMGNGQCPECSGCHAGWYGHPLNVTPDTIGHQRGCILASALQSEGADVLWVGEFEPTAEQEKRAEFERGKIAAFDHANNARPS